MVAKFLCQGGLASRLINFENLATNPYELWLEREPTNRYDPRAIMVRVRQADGLTKRPTTQTNLGGDSAASELVDLTLGYVPKDIAYNLSQVLDNPHICEILSVQYDKPKNKLSVKFGLRSNVLRDQRITTGQSGLNNPIAELENESDAEQINTEETKMDEFYYLRYFPRMPRELKRAIYSISRKMNLNRNALLQATEVHVPGADEDNDDLDDLELSQLQR